LLSWAVGGVVAAATAFAIMLVEMIVEMEGRPLWRPVSHADETALFPPGDTTFDASAYILRPTN